LYLLSGDFVGITEVRLKMKSHLSLITMRW